MPITISRSTPPNSEVKIEAVLTVTTDGLLKIGCHTFTFGEVEEFATVINVKPPPVTFQDGDVVNFLNERHGVRYRHGGLWHFAHSGDPTHTPDSDYREELRAGRLVRLVTNGTVVKS